MKAEVTAINTYSGEVVAFKTATELDLVRSYKHINEFIKALTKAKDEIKALVMDSMEDDEYQVGRYIWQKQTRRYFNYDLSAMRRLLDEDLVNTLVKPDKALISKHLKDLDADTAKELEASMVEERPPSTALVLTQVKER